MEFVLVKNLHSFKFRKYTFFPDRPIDVTVENDMCDLLRCKKVMPTHPVIPERTFITPIEKKAREGQLKIGILRVGGIGDTLQLGAHAKAIKRKFSDSFLTAYIRDRIDAEILRYNNYVDKVQQVGVESWDTIVERESIKHDIFYDFRYAVKVIFNTDKYPEYKIETNKKFLEYEKIYRDFCKSNYKIEKYGMNLIDFSNMVACLKGDENDIEFDLKDEQKGYSKVLRKQKYITIHISAGKFRVTKSWLIDRWQEIVNYLIKKGYTVVQVGDKGEPIVKGVSDLVGLSTIQETAWLLHRAQYHIDTEGGLVHLAKAVKTPSIVMFGATPVESFGYKNNINLRTKECSPCWYKTKDWYKKCPDGHIIPKCFELITTDIVKSAIDEFEEKYKNRKKIQDEKDDNLISIIIPVYNQIKYFLITINSIINCTKENFEIIVIDNGSNNDIKEFLKSFKQSKMFNIITNEKNLGFSKANNQGSKVAKGKYLCFLNSDVRVGEGWLNTLLNGINKENNIGMVGASGGRLDNGYRCVGVTRDNKAKYDYLEGWCLFIKKELFDKFGGFDEDFSPAFSEDADLSFRLRRGGYKTKIVWGVNIQHYGNKTVFSQTDFDVAKVSKENSLKLKEKLGKGRNR